MPSTSFLSIGVALSLLCIGQVLVFVIDRSRPHLRDNIPECCIFLLLGLVTSLLMGIDALPVAVRDVVGALDSSYSSLVLTILLPPVILFSAVDLGRGAGAVPLHTLTRYAFPGLVLAGVGTLVSAGSAGLLLFAAGAAGVSHKLSLAGSFLLGSVVSATDTIGVIEIFNRLRPAHDVFAMTYLESIFNDATSIVLFHTLVEFASGRTTPSAATIAWASSTFFIVFIGSLLVGALVAGLGYALFRFGGLAGALSDAGALDGATDSALQRVLLSAPAQVEVVIFCISGFVAYMAAEGVGFSGVVGCLAAGILLGRFVLPLVSPPSAAFALALLKLLAGLCDKMAYIGLGVALPELRALGSYWGTALVLLFVAVVARVVGVGASSVIVNWGADAPFRDAALHAALPVRAKPYFCLPPVPAPLPSPASAAPRTMNPRTRLVIFWAGLRGGVAFALASAAGEAIEGAGDPAGSTAAPVATLFVCVVTIAGVSATLPALLRYVESLRGASDDAGETVDAFPTAPRAPADSLPSRGAHDENETRGLIMNVSQVTEDDETAATRVRARTLREDAEDAMTAALFNDILGRGDGDAVSVGAEPGVSSGSSAVAVVVPTQPANRGRSNSLSSALEKAKELARAGARALTGESEGTSTTQLSTSAARAVDVGAGGGAQRPPLGTVSARPASTGLARLPLPTKASARDAALRVMRGVGAAFQAPER